MTPVPHFTADSLLALWRRQAQAHPDTAAVAFGDIAVSYRELDCLTDELADHLKNRGVMPGDRVGVCLERSPRMPMSVLAVLKVGAAYLPLDPRYPADRLAFMLADGDVCVLLTERTVPVQLAFDPSRTVLVDDLLLPLPPVLRGERVGVRREVVPLENSWFGK